MTKFLCATVSCAGYTCHKVTNNVSLVQMGCTNRLQQFYGLKWFDGNVAVTGIPLVCPTVVCHWNFGPEKFGPGRKFLLKILVRPDR